MKISLVGGGTAGHVEPALAVGHWLRTNYPEVDIEFVGTASGLETTLVPANNFALATISKVPLPRKISFALLALPFKFLHVLNEATKVLEHTDLVIGFGGYVSAPCYLVAKLHRLPILIHEQNAKPGIANRFGARLTKNVLIAFPQARRTNRRWHNSKMVGMPLREAIVTAAQQSQSEQSNTRLLLCEQILFDPILPIVTIFGGSQGSRNINEVVKESLPELLRLGVQVIHGVGKGNELPSPQKGYLPLSYLNNMADLYASSDVIIARSGAVTCAEIAAFPRFAILIPLPIGNGEQKANAAELVSQGFAEVIANQNFTKEWLIQNILEMVERGNDIRHRAHASQIVNSAEIIGLTGISLLKLKGRSE